MNIGFVLIPYQHYSGVGEYYRNLFSQLLEIDRTNTYTVFLPPDAGEIAFTFFGRERCVVTGIPSSPSYVRYPRAILGDRTIENHRPRIDLLHCFNFPLPGFSGKTVMTVHDLREDDLPQYFNPLVNALRRRIVKNNLRRVDSVIAVSDFTLDRLLRHYPFCRGKATRVHHGIRSHDIRSSTPRLHPRPYLLTVGHMYPYKNQRNLLRAFNRLIRNPAFLYDLVVVGGTYSSREYFRSLQNVVTDKERVVFTGAVSYSDLASYYAHADLFVFPSLYEGFGFPLFEAIAHDVPVACSDVPVFNELLQCPEATFDPHSDENIALTISMILSNPPIRERILTQGKKRLAFFTWEKTAKETLAIYEQTGQKRP
jgi:glycosyltransferase involved in cell wall biosynthesis